MASSSSRLPKSGSLGNAAIDEQKALLQRVTWSRQIEKSARIRDFLVFVCERTYRTLHAELHEQEIGCRVFGRPTDYDTTADNIVRVTASQARKKLEQYFATEGAAEPVILEIPKGGYTPVFRERTRAAAESDVVPVPLPEQWYTRHRRLILILACCAPLFALTSVWSLWNLRVERASTRSGPGCRSDPPRPLVAIAHPRRRHRYRHHGFQSQPLPGTARPPTHAPGVSEARPVVAGRRSLGESGVAIVRAARRTTPLYQPGKRHHRISHRALAGKDRSHVNILAARDFNIRQMKSDNVILLGSIRANPWVELIAERLNFRFGFDQKSRYSYFENLAPRAGEEKLYPTDSGMSYCHIALLPNLGRTGNILAIAGTEVEGTEGGGEFVTNERSMSQLRPCRTWLPTAACPISRSC